MATFDEVRTHVFSLPLADRIALVRELSESLDEEGVEFDLHPDWIEEIDQRCEAYDRGEIEAVNAEDSLRRIRDAIERSRAT